MKSLATLTSTQIKTLIGIATIATMFLGTATLFERKAETAGQESNNNDNYLDGLRTQQVRDCADILNLQPRTDFVACIQRVIPRIGFRGRNQVHNAG